MKILILLGLGFVLFKMPITGAVLILAGIVFDQ